MSRFDRPLVVRGLIWISSRLLVRFDFNISLIDVSTLHPKIINAPPLQLFFINNPNSPRCGRVRASLASPPEISWHYKNVVNRVKLKNSIISFHRHSIFIWQPIFPPLLFAQILCYMCKLEDFFEWMSMILWIRFTYDTPKTQERKNLNNIRRSYGVVLSWPSSVKTTLTAAVAVICASHHTNYAFY